LIGVFALSVCILAAGLIAIKRVWTSSNPVPAFRQMTLRLGQKTFTLDIADTDELRAKGLGDRLSMPQDQGMIFLFPKPGIYEFWMKDTHFPLDIIWLNGKTIVDIKTLPSPAPGETPARYTPKVEADTVIELHAGLAQELGLEPGQSI